MRRADLCEKLIRLDRLLMILRRRDVSRHLRVVRCCLIMATAMNDLSGIISMGLSQREIFARR